MRERYFPYIFSISIYKNLHTREEFSHLVMAFVFSLVVSRCYAHDLHRDMPMTS